jgi:predicted DNA-binding transcriptional regulator YafY
LIAIGTALRAHEVLRFDYASPGVTEWVPPRKVEPHHLVTWGGRWYLVAWDLDRNDWRTFRVDRMLPKTPTGPRFTPRELPAPDVSTYIASKFTGKSQWPCRGEAILQAKAADIAQWAGRDAIVEEITETSCRLILNGWSWTGLAATFGMFEAELEFVGPVELKKAAAQLAIRYAKA